MNWRNDFLIQNSCFSEASGTQNKHMVAPGLVLQRYNTESVNFQRDWKQSKLDLQKLLLTVQRTTNL